MSEMLKAGDITMPLADGASSDILTPRSFAIVHGSLLLRTEYEKAKHVKSEDFPDRTGFECFVNHVHLPYAGTPESFRSCLQYALALEKYLSEFGEGRVFLVLLSVSDNGCVVRFHQNRPNERWIADDLEGYSEEAILVLTVGSPEISAHP
jgi:hypothetical protein